VQSEVRGHDEIVGEPVRLHAYVAGQRDAWFVPILSDGRVVRVMSLPVDADGTLYGPAVASWNGRFPHALTQPEAATKASSPDDPIVTLDLDWAVIDPREGGPASEVAPFYLVTRRSGQQFVVFGAGNVVPAVSVHPYH
jgi:hypothetical protein